MIRALLFERLGVTWHPVSALPGTSVGRDYLVKLKKLRRRLPPHLAVPPSLQSPVTTTITNLGYLNVRLTRANLGQATTGLIEGFNRAGFAQRSEVAA